jgi:hypothetical protein
MRNVRISPVVARLCGGRGRVEALLVEGSEYACTECRARGRLGDEPVHLNVTRYGTGAARATFTHTRCGDATVTVTDAPHPASADGLTDVTAVPLVASTPFGAWPVLLVERLMVSVKYTPLPTADHVDQFLTIMGEWGMQPVPSVFRPPPATPGWVLTLPGAGDGGSVRYGPLGADGVLMAPLDDVGFPPLWFQALLERGGVCAVYALSRVPLRALNERPIPEMVAGLDAAALAGLVMGATATVTR